MKNSVPHFCVRLAWIACCVPLVASGGALKVRFNTAEGAPKPEGEVRVEVQRQGPGSPAQSFTSREPSFTKEFADLPPGTYQVRIWQGTETFPEIMQAPPVPSFASIRHLVVGEDDPAPAELHVTYDPTSIRGTREARVQLRGVTGETVTDAVLRLIAIREEPNDPTGRGMMMTSVAEVKAAGAEGWIALTGLADETRYQLLDSTSLDWFPLKVGEDNTHLRSGNVQVGDLAPDIEFALLGKDKPARLSDYRGRVVVLDFWASWCGPCQEPMAKMQTYGEDNPEWKDRVALIALSIDDTQEAATDHLQKKGWDKSINAWSEGWQSFPPKRYGVKGIPTVFLIDAEGRVTHRGHPAVLSIPERINELLAAKSP